MRATVDTDVLVIGAGPYGLSLAAYARQRGISCVVVGRPMDSWLRQMPKGMFLKSEGFASNIAEPSGAYSLKRFCEESGREYGDRGVPVPIETFTDYGLWFQRAMVPGVEQAEVESVSQTRGAFEVCLGAGATMRVRRVVVASGLSTFRYVPAELLGLPAEVVSHSAQHRVFDRFAGLNVAVVGAGQSALESAALLREQGALPLVVARKPLLTWNGVPEGSRRPLARRVRHPITGLGVGWESWLYSEVPLAFSTLPRATRVRLVQETFGPAGAWWLRDRIENRVPVLLGRTLRGASAEDGKIKLCIGVDGREETLVADHVLAATGYRVDLERLSFLAPELRRRLVSVAGAPVLSTRLESSVPGLYFVGLAAAHTLGPVMRFVYGTRVASSRLTGQLARRRTHELGEPETRMDKGVEFGRSRARTGASSSRCT